MINCTAKLLKDRLNRPKGRFFGETLEGIAGVGESAGNGLDKNAILCYNKESYIQL